jgi:hypothetical protein
MIVQFKDVGRNKKSWEDRISVPSFEALGHCVKKSGALMSRDLDFDEDPDGMGGQVYAGMRVVGSYKLISERETCE